MQKILIVEDDIDIQDILKNHLIDAGYEVAVASDGVAGIAMFDDTIDLLLLDIMLPKIDGYGVCEVIPFMCKVIRCPSIRQQRRFGKPFRWLYWESSLCPSCFLSFTHAI